MLLELPPFIFLISGWISPFAFSSLFVFAASFDLLKRE
jgi:hypothetical protein